jgi:hypothetical protein
MLIDPAVLQAVIDAWCQGLQCRMFPEWLVHILDSNRELFVMGKA